MAKKKRAVKKSSVKKTTRSKSVSKKTNVRKNDFVEIDLTLVLGMLGLGFAVVSMFGEMRQYALLGMAFSGLTVFLALRKEKYMVLFKSVVALAIAVLSVAGYSAFMSDMLWNQFGYEGWL